MELININIICFQIFKALFQILKQLLSPCGSGLCGNEKLIPDLFKGKPQFMLTVTIGSCRIKKADPAFKSTSQNPYGSFVIYPLDRQCAKAIFFYNDLRASKSYLHP